MTLIQFYRKIAAALLTQFVHKSDLEKAGKVQHGVTDHADCAFCEY